MSQDHIQFGFPEFRSDFNGRFGPVIQALQNCAAALNGIVDRAYESIAGWQRVVLNLGRLNGVAMMELVTLAENGFGHGAMKILRSMLETTIDAEFLRQDPGRFSEYLDWSHLERWKVYESLKRVAPSAYEQLGAAEVARARDEFDRVSPFFRRGGRNHNRWCGLNLRVESQEARLETLYEMINPLASKMLHGGMFGLLLHFNTEVDVHRIDVPPSMKWVQQALVGGHACLRHTIGSLSQALEAEPEPDMARLEQEETDAWQAVTQRDAS